jgi:hopanoid-associated phosphorylase
VSRERPPSTFLLVVSGLLVEARIASGSGVRGVVGGGNAARLVREIERAISDGARALLSFGIAGGLEPGLASGTIIVPDLVIAGEERFPTDAAWSRQLRARLPDSLVRTIAGTDYPIVSVPAKARLRAETGAAAADMESHHAARAAARTGLSLAAVRVIADPAHRAVPAAAVAGMGEDGRADLRALLAALARHPRDVGPLMRIAADARRAIGALARCKQSLGATLAPLPDAIRRWPAPGTFGGE